MLKQLTSYTNGFFNEDAKIIYLRLSTGCVVRIKRRLADDHFVEDDPDRPPVAGLGVPLLQQDLWRDVVGRAHQRVRHAALQLLPSSPLQWLHPVGHVGARAAPVLQVLHVDWVH